MRRTTSLIPLMMLLVAAAGSAIARSAAAEGSKARAKARHFMLQNAANMDGEAERYELARRALAIDPTYPEAAWAVASGRAGLRLDTMNSEAETNRTLELARTFVDAYPADYDEGMMYAYWNNSLMRPQESIRVLARLDTLYPERTDILAQMADAYLRMGDRQGAIGTINRYERIEGASPQLALRKISIYLSDNDTASVIAEADKLVDSNPGRSEMRIIRGRVYSYIGNDSLALVNYLDAERLEPAASEPKRALSDYYREHGEMDNYDLKIYEAILSDDLDPAERVELAGMYLGDILNDSVDNTARAEKLLANLMDRYPHEAEVQKLNAQYLFSKERTDEAIESMAYAVELNPTDAELWSGLMLMAAFNGNYERVKDTYMKSQGSVNPTSQMLSLYGIACTNTDDFDHAIAIYHKMISELLPGRDVDAPMTDMRLVRMLPVQTTGQLSNLYTILGDAYNQAGRKNDSWRAYDNALVFNPDEAMALNNYAYFLALDGGDLEKAATMSHRSQQLNSTNPTFMDTYAWILYLQGDYEGAYRYQTDAINAAREQDSLSAEFFNHMGDICYRMGNVEEALKYWCEAQKLDPDDKEIQNKIRTRSLPK